MQAKDRSEPLATVGRESLPPHLNPLTEPTRPRFGTLPFAVTLAGSVGLLVLLAVAAVLAIQWRASERNTLGLLNDQAVLIVDRIETGVRLHLQPAIALADFAARQIESGAIDPADREAMNGMLTGALASAPQISGALFVDPSLRQVGLTRQRDGIVPVDRVLHESTRIRSALEELQLTAKAFWGPPVYTDQGETVINLRQPLRHQGRFLGALFIGITVPELSEIVTETGDLFGATAFILYDRQRVLAHPFLVSARAERSQENPLVPLDQTGDIVLASIWEGRPIPGFEEAAESGVEVKDVSVGPHDYVTLYKWNRDYGDIPWTLGAWFPADDVSTELRRLWLAGAAGLVVLLFAILTAIMLARFIARPISRVATSTAKIGILDLEHVDRLPPSAIRELNDQARAFNSMLAGLRSFETYVPRSLVTRLIRDGDTRALGSEERELTVMFTDIVDFTAMCEGMPAPAVAQFLNEHFALLGACVEAEDGTVDKFIGDALMAFWGAPDKQKDRAPRACRAALDIAKAVEADNVERTRRGAPPIRLRIGVHTGPVVVGNIGWPGRINYTIVGDTVNASQRLEALGKEMGGKEMAGKLMASDHAVTILISGETAERLGPEFKTEHVGNFEIRGRRAPIEIYRLLA